MAKIGENKWWKYSKKLIKIGIALLIGFYVVMISILGFKNVDIEKGIYKFRWSGLKALFSDKPFGLFFDKPIETYLSGCDGPYLLKDSIYLVSHDGKFIRDTLGKRASIQVPIPFSDSFFNVTWKDSFFVPIQRMDRPEKVVAISDIEGSFENFVTFLKGNQVIDENYNWIFGSGHLVLVGDFMDRGKNVLPVLWLIYKMENEAIKRGGYVHFVLGNHEVMNLQGQLTYAKPKYREVAKRISRKTQWGEAARYTYGKNSFLGRWLRTKPAVIVLGEDLYVHGGISPWLLSQKMDLNEVNQQIKNELNQITVANKAQGLCTKNAGPLWYRELVDNEDLSHEEVNMHLQKVCKYFDVKHLVVGHTVVGDIQSKHDHQFIAIDVKHGHKKMKGLTKGLIVEENQYFSVDQLGRKNLLF